MKWNMCRVSISYIICYLAQFRHVIENEEAELEFDASFKFHFDTSSKFHFDVSYEFLRCEFWVPHHMLVTLLSSFIYFYCYIAVV